MPLMKPIYLLATIAMMTEKVSFFISTATIAKDDQEKDLTFLDIS